MSMQISSIAVNCPPASGSQPASGVFTASVETVEGAPVINVLRDGELLFDFKIFELPPVPT